ncbi:MAG: MASE1 domain-containing protein [Chromatiales bacterium]|nr:MASE1 domain-containing protein [Chromatiales bacterium]
MNLYQSKPYQAALVTGIGYYLAGLFAVHFTIMPEGIAIMWPPNAFLLAAFLLSPKRHWWLFAVAGAIAEFAADIGNFPVWQILGFAAVNLSETLFSAYLIGRLSGNHPLNLTLKNLGIAVGVILLAGPPIAALAGAQIYALGDPSINYWQFWRLWWFGDATGLIVTLPLILSLSGSTDAPFVRIQLSKLEIAGLIIVPLLAGSLLLTPLYNSMPWAASPVLLMLFLVWIAMRTPPIITTSAGLLISLATTLATTSGIGPFASGTNEAASVLAIQEFLVAISILGLFLSFAFSEVHRVNRKLERLNDELEIKVADRTQSLSTINKELRENLKSLETKLRAAERKKQALVTEMSETALNKAGMAQLNAQLMQRLQTSNEEVEVLREQIQSLTKMLASEKGSTI